MSLPFRIRAARGPLRRVDASDPAEGQSKMHDIVNFVNFTPGIAPVVPGRAPLPAFSGRSGFRRGGKKFSSRGCYDARQCPG